MNFILKNKIILLLSISTLIPSFAFTKPQEEATVATTQSTTRTSTLVNYHTTKDGQDIQGYLAQPKGDGPFPAIILIHEWVGLVDSIKAYANAFAEQGYVALAVDLYDGKTAQDTTQARELATAVGKNPAPAFENLQDAISYLKNLDNVDSDRLASVGWCFGGSWSYRVAVNNLGMKASIMYYGRFNIKDDFVNMKSTILGHFAENDRSILVDDVDQFQVVLHETNSEHAIYIYPDTDHGFAREQFTVATPSDASQLAWDRTLDFLEKHL